MASSTASDRMMTTFKIVIIFLVVIVWLILGLQEKKILLSPQFLGEFGDICCAALIALVIVNVARAVRQWLTQLS